MNSVEGFAPFTYGNFGTVFSSSLKNYNDGTKPIWTYRYISKYYPKIIQDNLHHFGGYFDLDTSLMKFTKQSISQNPTAKKFMNRLNKLINTSPKLFNPNYIYVSGNYIKIPVRPKYFYNTNHYYSPVYTPGTTFKTDILLKVYNSNIVGAKILKMKNIQLKSGYDQKRVYQQGVKEEQKYITNKQAKIDAKKVRKLQNEGDYHCFGTKDHDINFENDCIIQGGIWDRACKKNSDCKYYNKNYPNSHGQCNIVTGYCEMPLGMQNITYRKGKGKPQCYNCGKSKILGTCCDKQKQPDYAFNNDIKERRKNQQILKDKGLNWYKY
jgi:hypothetical protein